MSEDGTQTLVYPGVAMYLSARYFPVLIATWFGDPSVEIARRYVDWLEQMTIRAKEEGTKVVVLGDTTTVSRPSPEVRRAIALALAGFLDRNGDGFVGGATIIDKPLMRAVITTVMALTRNRPNFKPVKSLEAAFERIQELLQDAGIPWPEGLDPQTYQRPARPE